MLFEISTISLLTRTYYAIYPQTISFEELEPLLTT